MFPEPIQELEHTRLRRPTQVLIIHILQSKPNTRPLKPLKVIKDSPAPRPSHINLIIVYRREDIIKITLVVVRAAQIPQYGVLIRELAFKGLREPEFRHHDVRDRGEQLRREHFEKLADPGRRRVQPAYAWVAGGAGGEPGRRGRRAARAFGEAG
jgi:hypothetical protein